MSVEVSRDYGFQPATDQTAVTATGKKGAWTSRLKNAMDSDTRTEVLAAYTRRSNKEYIPGSYNEDPIVPPIINPPPAVTERGPNAPYYDAKLTGGPILRPDARVYNYDNCPSYMRAIIDWSYGRPKNGKSYPRDAEYSKVYYDLCNGNGYKGAFAMNPDPDFVWEPDISTKVLGAYVTRSDVLGAYTVNPYALEGLFDDEVKRRQFAATQYESTLFDTVQQLLEENPGQEAIIIDGDVVLLPAQREDPAMSQTGMGQNSANDSAAAYLSAANFMRQMRLGEAQSSEAEYRRRLAELGLDTPISI